ncbi:MAG: C1 family peptidase [Prevotellaceae bacterium]|jgi:C1A family cysteine protease|nr:C1 family peptidase [Prevotellaceae bacterium]
MKYFAHFFIGKEFAEVVSTIGKQTLKYGGNDAVSSVNLFLVHDAKVSKLQCSSTAADEMLSGFDSGIEVIWGEENNLEMTDNKALSDLYAKRIFDRILTINNRGDNSVLYVFLHFPLYKPEALETAKLLYNAIENSGKPTEIDFVGYCDDMADIIEPGFQISSPSSKQIATFAQFKEEKKMAYNRHFIAIQNASQNGISLGLNRESLGDVIARFAMLCVDYYDEIFPNTVEYKDVVSFGLSTLYLDKYLFVEYLLGKTILHLMNSAEVNNNEVDVNFACDTANLLLKDKRTLLSGLLKQMDASAKDEKEEFSKIQQQLEEEIAQIIEKCKEIFQVNKSITTRAAILAAILSKTECELFSKTIFNHDAVSIDNLFNEPIDYFIDNDKTGFYTTDGESPVNPIRELKEINNKLMNSETEIRDLQEHLSSLEKQISDVQKVEDCFIEDGFFHFHNQKFRLLPSLEQEPLAETYIAHENTVQSIDLRPNFNSIKNQGQQGSCLAHAITSIFEYAMKLNQEKELDLSEAFLYYNARHMDATGDVSIHTDTGSRFKPAMDALVQYGVALEKYCPYNENVYNQKPSEDAYQDAASRRLISAKNVNRKISDIKSALVDGYPVAVSFTLCPSFTEAQNGYIPMPNEQEIAEMYAEDAPKDKNFQHAMVITGFSDELQMFVVRNSWGEDWGDKGYCYVPFSYVENEKLCDFSCIISEIEQLSIPKMEHIPALKIDDADLNIKYIITKNSLQKELQEVANNRKQSDWLRVYFERIKKLFSAPNQRDEFIIKAKEHLAKEQEELRKEIKTRKDEQEEELNQFNLYKKQTIIQTASFVFGTVFFFAMYNYLLDLFSKSVCWFWDKGCDPEINWFWVIAFAAAIAGSIFFRKPFIKHLGLSLCVVGGILIISAIYTTMRGKFDYIFSYWWLIPVFTVYAGVIFYQANKRWREWRDHRDALDEEILRLNKKIVAKEKEIDSFKIKTFGAWALLKALEKAQTHFQLLYGNMISLINNLRIWYKEVADVKEKSQLETTTPNTSLLSAEILDAFFDNKLKENTDFEIDLCEGIENHKIEEEYLKNYKETFFNKIIKKLLLIKELKDFDISAHTVDNLFSAIAKPLNRDLVEDVDNKSGLFLHISSNERGIIVPSTGIYTPSLNLYKDSLRKKLGKYSEPYFESNDKYRLVFLKTATLWFRECVHLKSEQERT